MKKWKELSQSERVMLIVVGVLMLLVLLSSSRVNDGMQRGFRHFFSSSADTVQQLK